MKRKKLSRGSVSEIFSSWQGEGVRVGERQVFLRLAGCPWRCDYCDTPGSLLRQGHPVLTVKNTLRRVLAEARRWNCGAVTLTGGEPLSQPEFLRALCPLLVKAGLKIHLETSGTHPEALAAVLPWVSLVAMDIKPLSAVGIQLHRPQEACLKIAVDKVFVKMVLTSHTTTAEVSSAVRLLARQPVKPTFILQPVTPRGPVRRPDPQQVTAWARGARRLLPDVRVQSQKHPSWGIR